MVFPYWLTKKKNYLSSVDVYQSSYIATIVKGIKLMKQNKMLFIHFSSDVITL